MNNEPKHFLVFGTSIGRHRFRMEIDDTERTVTYSASAYATVDDAESLEHDPTHSVDEMLRDDFLVALRLAELEAPAETTARNEQQFLPLIVEETISRRELATIADKALDKAFAERKASDAARISALERRVEELESKTGTLL